MKDRSGLRFRCGDPNHDAGTCTASEPKCAPCVPPWGYGRITSWGDLRALRRCNPSPVVAGTLVFLGR